MAKGTTQMARDFISIRSLADKKSSQILSEWAEIEGRSQQMHTGILLRRLAAIFSESPEKLEEIGLLTPHIKTAVA